MLCANLFVAQLVFVVGVEKTENKVEEEEEEEEEEDELETLFLACMSICLFPPLVCLFSHCCVAPLPLPGCVHVDVDGGCGPLCSTGQSLHKTSRTLCCCLHHC